MCILNTKWWLVIDQPSQSHCIPLHLKQTLKKVGEAYSLQLQPPPPPPRPPAGKARAVHGLSCFARLTIVLLLIFFVFRPNQFLFRCYGPGVHDYMGCMTTSNHHTKIQFVHNFITQRTLSSFQEVLEKQLGRAQRQLAALQAEKTFAEDKNVKLPGENVGGKLSTALRQLAL